MRRSDERAGLSIGSSSESQGGCSLDRLTWCQMLANVGERSWAMENCFGGALREMLVSLF